MRRIEEVPLFPEHWGETRPTQLINVASVPQRSPFRYPGGKTWFVPVFRRWITSLRRRPSVLVEPFAGGGIISLTAIFEDLVPQAVMVELDEEVAAVWEIILEGEAEWLANQILSFKMTKDTVLELLNSSPQTKKEKAFQTIVKNRVLRGGILAKGSSLMKRGENGKGISSRWYPKTIARRIIDISRVAHRIIFRNEDGLRVMSEFANREDVIYFIDPPYTADPQKPGKRLYKYHQIDHEALFTLCQSLRGDFLMTYNASDEVKLMASRYGFELCSIPMKTAHHKVKWELVIGRDLSWMQDCS
ncbi:MULTISPECIES: DNA adenine methylase [Thermus]|jgi:DNA adenine methylase|uniref:DNA methyltransferase n=1 Tax=Thermus brockianus TaxID=56956 RepID=A0ABN6NMX9_THEBO|nr:DNA adenine methylase [Thermus brockianus]BDG17778.1 DNA methyltransferase [Thermus brockianus]